MTDKQIEALRAVDRGEPIAMVHAGKLKSAGLVETSGRSKPGYVDASLTAKGRAKLATL